MSFHITVKDNDNGKVLVDLDACSIVGGIRTEDKCTVQMCFTSGNMLIDGAAVVSAFISAEFLMRKFTPEFGAGVLETVKETSDEIIKKMEGAIV